MDMFKDIFAEGGITLERLMHFCEVARCGSISKAVSKHNRSQSSYSRDIKSLEEYFGHPLFESTGGSRSGKRLGALTPRGEALLHTVIEFFDAINKIIGLEEQLKVLRIGSGETILQWIIGSHLEKMHHEHPGLRIEFRNNTMLEIVRAVKSGTLDIGIVDDKSLAELPQEIAAVALGELKYSLYLSPALVEKSRKLSEKKLMESLPLAGFSDFLPPKQEEASGTPKGYQLELAVMVTSFAQMTTALQTNKLAGILPDFAEPEMNKIGLTKLTHTSISALSIPISLIWNQRMAGLRPSLAVIVSKLHSMLAEDLRLTR